MEGDAVVSALADQLFDLRNMLWRKVGTKLDGHVAILQLENHGVFGGRSGMDCALREREEGGSG